MKIISNRRISSSYVSMTTQFDCSRTAQSDLPVIDRIDDVAIPSSTSTSLNCIVKIDSVQITLCSDSIDVENCEC